MRFFIAVSTLLAVAVAKPGYSYEPAHGYHGPLAPLAHDGQVIDTPEVAHVKAAHFAAHAEAASKAGDGYGYDDGYAHGYSGGADGYTVPQAYATKIAHVGHAYHGPPAPLAHDGTVVDTPEVAHAKAAHLAAHAAAHYAAPAFEEHAHGYAGYGSPAVGGSDHGYGYASAPAQAYHGPSAPLAYDGTVVDTPEVAHAKAAHLATHAHAAAHTHHGGYGDASAYKW